MSDSYEVQIMRQFQNMCAIIGGNSEYWNDVDMTNKANVSAYIQTRKNTQHLLDFLKQNKTNRPAIPRTLSMSGPKRFPFVNGGKLSKL